jgi:FkbM family methyltransferase
MVVPAIVLMGWAPAGVRTRIAFAWLRSHGEVPGWLNDWAGPPVPIWYEMQPGVRMFLDPSDMGPAMILSSGEYEPASMAMLKEHLGPGKTFVDVGANFGVYSLVMARTGARVVAVEPNPESVERLRRNVMESGALVQIVPVAAGDKPGTMTLYVAPGFNTGETSLSDKNAGNDGPVQGKYEVQVETLDTILGAWMDVPPDRVDAIKIDVEGAELMVLRGARGILERWHPMLLVEIVDRQLVAMGTSATALRAWLWDAGYREGRHDGDNVEFVWGGCAGPQPGPGYECRTGQWGGGK